MFNNGIKFMRAKSQKDFNYKSASNSLKNSLRLLDVPPDIQNTIIKTFREIELELNSLVNCWIHDEGISEHASRLYLTAYLKRLDNYTKTALYSYINKEKFFLNLCDCLSSTYSKDDPMYEILTESIVETSKAINVTLIDMLQNIFVDLDNDILNIQISSKIANAFDMFCYSNT